MVPQDRDLMAGERPRRSKIRPRCWSRPNNLVQEAIQQATAGETRLFGIGLGVPGLVDHATGTLLFAPNLKWSNVPLRDMWRKRFGVPVVVENEANAATLGERMLGVARQVDNFIYLSAGVGLGGGLMIDGQVVWRASAALRRGRPHDVGARWPAVQLRQSRLLGRC